MELDLLKGDLTATDLGTRDAVHTGRSFLQNLHTLHAYPGVYGARWIWSLLVDIMGAAMFVWGLTGIVMWWKLRRLRDMGGVVPTVGQVTH